MIKGTYKAENPDDIEFTLTMTMTMSEWKHLRNQLDDTWPGHRVRAMILNMIWDAEKVFTATADAETRKRDPHSHED